MERRKKTEDARRETQAILDAQAEQVRQNKLEMERRDAERAKRMQLEAKERAVANDEKRKKADMRIQSEWGSSVYVHECWRCSAPLRWAVLPGAVSEVLARLG